MLAAGIKVGPSNEGEEKKKVTYDSRKRGKKNEKKVRLCPQLAGNWRSCYIEYLQFAVGRRREGIG